jgi:hypothetical protein
MSLMIDEHDIVPFQDFRCYIGVLNYNTVRLYTKENTESNGRNEVVYRLETGYVVRPSVLRD